MPVDDRQTAQKLFFIGFQVISVFVSCCHPPKMLIPIFDNLSKKHCLTEQVFIRILACSMLAIGPICEILVSVRAEFYALSCDISKTIVLSKMAEFETIYF